MESAGGFNRAPPFARTGIAARPDGRPLKALICDDERHIVRLIQVNLERQGYRVIAAFDGEEGLQKIRTERPDLCILDADMPGMDGFEVLRRIRQDPTTRDLMVVMLKGGRRDDRDENDGNDADIYLTKPFNPKNLFK